MKSLPNADQETQIIMGREDELANIWTSDKTMINKLDKLVAKEGSPWKCIDVGKNAEYGVLSKEYTCPKNLISFRSKQVAPRQLTEEEKQKKAEILKNYMENKKSKSLEDN